MKILITGAGGFLGKTLVELLSKEHQLFCLARSIKADFPKADSINWIETDLSKPLDTKSLPKELDAIIHLAQSNGYRDFPVQAPDVFKVNIDLVQQLCQYGVEVGIKQMVLASTGTVYEPFKGASMDEDVPLRPTGYYGASKLAAELISEAYSAQFKVANMRVFFLYGKGQENMLIARLIDNVKAGNKVSVPADGEGLVFVPTHVEDTALAFKHAVEDGWQGAYNVASPHAISFGALLATIAKATGKELNLEITDGSTPDPIVPPMDKLATKMDLKLFKTPAQGLKLTI